MALSFIILGLPSACWRTPSDGLFEERQTNAGTSAVTDGGSGGPATAGAPTLAGTSGGLSTGGSTGGAGAGGGGSAGADTSQAGSAEPPRTAELPSDVLDLSDWKLSVAVPSPRGQNRPSEIVQPELQAYALPPYFQLNPSRDGVSFRALAGGPTTEGADYPRTELREMIYGGTHPAAWSTRVGTHSLRIRQAITALPVVRPQVVAGRLYDSSDEIMRILLEGERLLVEGGGEELAVLNPKYQLGTEFTVKITASLSTVAVYYEDLSFPKVTLAREADHCYFKAGVSTQTNLEHGDAADAYAEVVIRELELEHRP